MKITHLIAENILTVFEGDNWTEVCLAETLQNISWQQAQQQTTASPNTIASLAQHLNYWNEIVMQRMNGFAPEIPVTNGYDVPVFNNENNWKELISATHTSFKEISEAVKKFPEERLKELVPNKKSTYYVMLQGIAEHAHYHLGQMVILKHLLLKREAE